jgi:hypothetical protein
MTVTLAVAGAACTTQQGYGAAQAWQQNECRKLQDQEQRTRCLKSNAKTYEEYQRQASDLRKKN